MRSRRIPQTAPGRTDAAAPTPRGKTRPPAAGDGRRRVHRTQPGRARGEGPGREPRRRLQCVWWRRGGPVRELFRRPPRPPCAASHGPPGETTARAQFCALLLVEISGNFRTRPGVSEPCRLGSPSWAVAGTRWAAGHRRWCRLGRPRGDTALCTEGSGVRRKWVVTEDSLTASAS